MTKLPAHLLSVVTDVIGMGQCLFSIKIKSNRMVKSRVEENVDWTKIGRAQRPTSVCATKLTELSGFH